MCKQQNITYGLIEESQTTGRMSRPRTYALREIFHARLKAPDFEAHPNDLVGAHDWLHELLEYRWIIARGGVR